MLTFAILGPFPSFSKSKHPHKAAEPISVIHIQKPQSLYFLMVKELNYFRIAKYVKIAFLAERVVFPFFCCPGKLFTKMVITPTFSTSTGFMMAHFEAKIQEKAIENPKTSAVKGQMLVILRQCEVMGKGVTQKVQF